MDPSNQAATHRALAQAQTFVKPELREAGMVFYRKFEETGKKKKVYKVLKVVGEVDQVKESDDDAGESEKKQISCLNS